MVGHNPSTVAWATGHFYANPSNRFWPMLRSTGHETRFDCAILTCGFSAWSLWRPLSLRAGPT